MLGYPSSVEKNLYLFLSRMAPTLSGTEDEVCTRSSDVIILIAPPLFISVPIVLHVIGVLLFRASTLSKSMRKTRGSSDEWSVRQQFRPFRPKWLGNIAPIGKTYY